MEVLSHFYHSETFNKYDFFAFPEKKGFYLNRIGSCGTMCDNTATTTAGVHYLENFLGQHAMGC